MTDFNELELHEIPIPTSVDEADKLQLALNEKTWMLFTSFVWDDSDPVKEAWMEEHFGDD